MILSKRAAGIAGFMAMNRLAQSCNRCIVINYLVLSYKLFEIFVLTQNRLQSHYHVSEEMVRGK